MTTQRAENATLAGSLSGQLEDMTEKSLDNEDMANAASYQRDENATRVGELEEELKNTEADRTDLIVGGIVGSAVAAAIVTKRARKPEVDYGPDEEE